MKVNQVVDPDIIAVGILIMAATGGASPQGSAAPNPAPADPIPGVDVATEKESGTAFRDPVLEFLR